MSYLTQEDQTCTRSSDDIAGNYSGRTSAPNGIELANVFTVKAPSGTHH